LSPLSELPKFSLDGRQVTIEAENLLLGTPYQTATIGSDAASGRRYVENPSIAFTVILKEDSALTFSGLVRGPGEFNNSFWVRIDRGPLLLWDIPIQDQFVWDLMHDRGKLPSATQLAAGTHMVLVFTRESGSQIEALRINAS
jgi:hypothetical protein